MTRGFGVAAAGGPALAAGLAPVIEELGYRSLWTNDTPDGDGLAFAAAAMRASSTLRIGIGALPCDRRGPDEVIAALADGRIDLGRLALVVGAGKAASPVEAVAAAVQRLRDHFGASLCIGVAALGAGMCRLGGRIADLVLLNWADPRRIAWSKERIAEGARRRTDGRSGPEVAAYVRAALGPAAPELLEAERARYRRIPSYARHFEAMGGEPALAASGPADLKGLLHPYEELLDETVVRAVPGGPAPQDDLLALARAGSA